MQSIKVVNSIIIETCHCIAGCSHLAPWLYPLYLIGLLVLFAVEDEKRCAKKYGLSWDEYKARVKYVMIPYVY